MEVLRKSFTLEGSPYPEISRKQGAFGLYVTTYIHVSTQHVYETVMDKYLRV